MEEDQISRIAIGVFKPPIELEEAIAMLQENIATDCSMAVIGCPEVVDSVLPGRTTEKCGDFAVCAVERKSRDDGEGASPRYATSFEEWLDPSSASRLKRYIQDGACVLFILFSGVANGVSIYRALMKLVSGRVELHDLPPGA